MDWFLKSSQNELENILMMTLCAGKKNRSKNQTPAIGFHRNPTITPKSRLWRNHHFPMENIPMEKGFRQKPIFHRKRLVSDWKISMEKWPQKKQMAPFSFDGGLCGVTKKVGGRVSIRWKEKFRRQGKKVATLALYASAVMDLQHQQKQQYTNIQNKFHNSAD